MIESGAPVQSKGFRVWCYRSLKGIPASFLVHKAKVLYIGPELNSSRFPEYLLENQKVINGRLPSHYCADNDIVRCGCSLWSQSRSAVIAECRVVGVVILEAIILARKIAMAGCSPDDLFDILGLRIIG